MRDSKAKRNLPSRPHGGRGEVRSPCKAVRRTTCKKAQRGWRAWKHRAFCFICKKAWSCGRWVWRGHPRSSRVCLTQCFPLAKRNTVLDPQWMPQITDSTTPYIYYIFFLYIHIPFHLKEGCLWLLFGIFKLPASLLMSFGAITKLSNDNLNTALWYHNHLSDNWASY